MTLVVREGKRLRAIAATAGPESTARPGGVVRRAVAQERLDRPRTRIRLSVEPRREWRQMLREVWRLQRDQFWVADMSGVDWDAVLRRYEPLLARVATRGELSDLIWEMQGELGTSHAYEIGRRPPPAAADRARPPGGRAASRRRRRELRDHAHRQRRRVGRGADSPLNAVGVEARVGERIVAVNGQRVSRERPPQALLVHQAGAKVELTLARPRAAAPTRTVLVTTLADEAPARYREWVERNRAWVHEQSGGRVGYFHLPDMMSAGFAEFHRYFAPSATATR